jgi:hypothetical protein
MKAFDHKLCHSLMTSCNTINYAATLKAFDHNLCHSRMTSRTTQHNHAATLQDGLTLGDLVRAFGTKAQADAFQAAVPELLQDSGFKPMRWDRDGEGHGALFPTEIHARGCHWFPRLLA